MFMPTLEELELLRAAWRGEFKELAKRMREGTDLSPVLRDLIADILEGKLKNPKHRPKRGMDTFENHVRLGEEVRRLEREGLPTKAAVADVAEKERCSGARFERV